MNLESVKQKIKNITRVPTDRNVLVGEVNAFLNNPDNKITDKQKEAGKKFLAGIFKNWDKAAEKAREKTEMSRRKQAAAAKKLVEENPYYITSDGIERIVKLSVTSQNGNKKHGSFSGRSSIAIPAAEAWAKYRAKSQSIEVSIVDFGNRERPVIARFDNQGNKKEEK